MCNNCVPIVSKLTQKIKGYKDMFTNDPSKNNFNNVDIEDDVQWWKAGEEDGFDLSRKLARVGCRPIYRKYMNCTRQQDQFACQDTKDELNKCLNMLQFVQASKQDI